MKEQMGAQFFVLATSSSYTYVINLCEFVNDNDKDLFWNISGQFNWQCSGDKP